MATAKFTLSEHTKSVHQGFLRYSCTICEFKSARSSSLARHIQSKHKEKKYQCNSCHKEYKGLSGLRLHTKAIHEGVSYDCNICQHKTSQKGYLTVHIKTVHLRERQFKCELCEYKTSHKCHLSRHIKHIHQKEKREMTLCAECNKSIQKVYVTKDMKVFHSKQQYTCKSCNFQTFVNAVFMLFQTWFSVIT